MAHFEVPEIKQVMVEPVGEKLDCDEYRISLINCQ